MNNMSLKKPKELKFFFELIHFPFLIFKKFPTYKNNHLNFEFNMKETSSKYLFENLYQTIVHQDNNS